MKNFLIIVRFAFCAIYASSQEPEKKSKKGYTVEVDVKNGNDKLDFSFYISESGSATLSVSSTNRQSITYIGDIIKTGEKNK